MDYINCWCALSLECENQLSKASTMEMCTQGIALYLLYVLQISKPRTFQELSAKAHDMKVMMANHLDNSFDFTD